MKKVISTVLIAAALILCTGCGAGAQAGKTVSMYELRMAMEAADTDHPEMLNASSAEKKAEENFSYISDMDYKKVDSYFVSYAKEGTADEIAVIAVKNPADVQEAKESLAAHQNDRHKLLEQYKPEEVVRVDDGLIFTKGQYAVLIISDHNNDIRKAFNDMIDGK